MSDVTRFESLLQKHRSKPSRADELDSHLEKHRSSYNKTTVELSAPYISKIVPAISISTGIASLDISLGGGLPAGFIEIFGEESVGKTALAYSIIRQAQESSLRTVLLCGEFLDEPYLEKVGVDTSSLAVMRSGCGESVLEHAGILYSTGDIDVLVVDSATGLRPKEDNGSGWRNMIYHWMSHLMPDIGLDKCVVMVNQVRAKRSIDPSRFFAGGSDSVARKIAGMFDTRMELSRSSLSDSLYDLNINIVSNTLSRPGRIVTVPFVKGHGIDRWKDLVRVATSAGVLRKEGSWYRYGGEILAQGEGETARVLKNSSIGVAVLKEVRSFVR